MAGEAADVVAALQGRGFRFLNRTPSGRLTLEGPLSAGGGEHPCELLLDPTFQEPPSIRLLGLPAGISEVNPHLGVAGSLCYIAKGTVVLDIFDPVGQTLACVQRAGAVLDAVLRGELYQDLEDEFFAFWLGHPCLVDTPSKQMGQQETLLVEVGDEFLMVVTNQEAQTWKKLDALKWKVNAEYTALTYRVRTRVKPRPLTSRPWPPATVNELLAWQGLLDPQCRRSIEKRLLQAQARHVRRAVILITSPLLTYGFVAHFDRPRDKPRPNATPRERLGLYEIAPLSVTRIDDRYISERNMPGSQTLAGKRLVLVGCGTIGGFLAELLVKAGAGTLGGELTLIDPDTLSPANLGRHRLGLPALFDNKARALADELVRGTPSAVLRALPVDVRDANLGAFDLLVDATGEESLGHWLSAEHRKSGPMLTVWVEGPGTAVRGLLHTNKSGACYRCLWHANRNGAFKAVKGEVPALMAGQGCEGLYVPFAATVSVQAAALGAEMALGWANEVVSPALRTRVLDSRFVSGTPDCDPPRVEDCPACTS